MQFKNNDLTIFSLISVVYYVRTQSVNIRITNTTVITFILSFCFLCACTHFVCCIIILNIHKPVLNNLEDTAENLPSLIACLQNLHRFDSM